MTPAQDATALLPCPFCGANNPQHMYSEYCRELTSPGFNREQSRIWCSICGATVIKKNCEEAIRTWNTRATSQTPEAVGETLADCIEAAELRGRSLGEIFTPLERRTIAASLRVKSSAGREVVGWRTLNGVDETWKFKPVVDQAFVDQLRARADCIRATNFVHIGEQDARDFAALFDKAAEALSTPSASAGPQDSTCYIERSKVREILIGQPDENVHVTEDILREVDGLTIFTAADFQPSAGPQAEAGTFQQRVDPWLMECFGLEIARDIFERNHRFLEEAIELVQANGCTVSEAHQLVDYVFGRDQGDINQEVGGVMVTLAALCLASGVDMHAAAETELARVWTKVEKIRAKHFAKPKFSPLLGYAQPQQADGRGAVIEFEYCNWEGRKSLRQARPISIRFGKSEWHPKPQWLMRAFDIDKGEEREFAMADMEFEEDALATLALQQSPATDNAPETK